MNAILYILIFIIGTLFGSFFTLAVYRIPLGENIVYKHSFCPNCKSELKFKDLIPILSYLFLGGKCAYCGKKIRIRYLLLEIFSGLVFVLFAYSLKLNMLSLNVDTIIKLSLFLLYIASLFIIAGIDKENINIQRSLLVFGMILSSCYMTYVCIHDTEAVYTYIIYLILTIILLIADIIFLKKKQKQSYTIGCIMLVVYMIIFSGSRVVYFTILLSLIYTTSSMLYTKFKRIRNKISNNDTKVTIGFYLSVFNIILLILHNFLL